MGRCYWKTGNIPAPCPARSSAVPCTSRPRRSPTADVEPLPVAAIRHNGRGFASREASTCNTTAPDPRPRAVDFPYWDRSYGGRTHDTALRKDHAVSHYGAYYCGVPEVCHATE